MKVCKVLFFLIAMTVITANAHTRGDFGVCGSAADPAVFRPSDQTLYYLSTCTGTYSGLSNIGQNSGDQWLPFNNGGSSDVFGDFSGFNTRWNLYDRFGALVDSDQGAWNVGGTAFAADVYGTGVDASITYYQGVWKIYPNPQTDPSITYTYNWGDPSHFDKPVVGDFNGDGKAEIAYWRPNQASADLQIWYLYDGHKESLFIGGGPTSDHLVTADIDGDGKDEVLKIFMPSDGRPYNWTVRLSTSGLLGQLDFGTEGDIPVPADYLGQGRDQIAIFRPSTGQWGAVDLNTFSAVTVGIFGTTGDIPIQGGRVH